MRASLSLLDNIIISVEPKYAEAILAGEKVYELRRRQFRVKTGTRVWLYAKKPLGAVLGFAYIADIHEFSPGSIWRKFGQQSAIQRKDFFAYFVHARYAYAIQLIHSARLSEPVSLHEMRGFDASFHPPQFFKRFAADDTILMKLIGRIGEVQK